MPIRLDQDALNARLEAEARTAWSDIARVHRWTLWARLSFAWPVSESTASGLIEQWASQLRARVPGAAVLVGLHDDAGRRHPHALVFVPQRIADPVYPTGVSVVSYNWAAWLALDWKHGHVWAERYSPGRTARGPHGAGSYLARFPGTVMLFGTPPQYRPHRSH